MHTVHRVYIGARNTPSHKFLPRDEIEIARILKKYLREWTLADATGYWNGVAEETLILTVVESPQTQTGYGNGLVSAMGEIPSFLKQYAILWESKGRAIVVPTNKKPAPVPAPSPLAAAPIGRKPKAAKSSPPSPP